MERQTFRPFITRTFDTSLRQRLHPASEWDHPRALWSTRHFRLNKICGGTPLFQPILVLPPPPPHAESSRLTERASSTPTQKECTSHENQRGTCEANINMHVPEPYTCICWQDLHYHCEHWYNDKTNSPGQYWLKADFWTQKKSLSSVTQKNQTAGKILVIFVCIFLGGEEREWYPHPTPCFCTMWRPLLLVTLQGTHVIGLGVTGLAFRKNFQSFPKCATHDKRGWLQSHHSSYRSIRRQWDSWEWDSQSVSRVQTPNREEPGVTGLSAETISLASSFPTTFLWRE